MRDSTSPGCSPASAARTRASRWACARASPPTCFGLAADELDAAFCLLAGDLSDEFAVERLGDEEVVAAFAPDRAPAAPESASRTSPTRRSSRRAAARPSPSALGRLFADAGRPLRLALESGDPFLLRSLAARGFATAILPRSFTAVWRVGAGDPQPPSRRELPVALVWRRERNLPPPARMFIEFVRRESEAARDAERYGGP